MWRRVTQRRCHRANVCRESADLHRDFKSERFGTRGQCPCRVERVPRGGVRVVRDRFDVPLAFPPRPE